MLGAALQCSMFLTSHKDALRGANSTKAAYLFQPDKLHWELDTGDKTIQCGRKSDSFKIWLLWKQKGDAGLARVVDRCMQLAEFTADFVRKDTTGAWQLVYEPSCSNVCFWSPSRPRTLPPSPPVSF